MRVAKGAFLLFILLAVSCPGPGRGPTPIDSHTTDLPVERFCIDFEERSNPDAVNRANAALLYSDSGVVFTSNPQIHNNSALSSGFQSLFQGDPRAARPELTCGPLEFNLLPDLHTKDIEFEARNIGFISYPVLVTATAFGEDGGTEVVVDERNIISESRFGDLRPYEVIGLSSSDGEPPITRVRVEYGRCPYDVAPGEPCVPSEEEEATNTTCLPHVVIDNLCITPEEKPGTFVGSDRGADRLVYYFDNEGIFSLDGSQRRTYLQLANIKDTSVEVHVQIWIGNSSILACEEYDFFDTLTAFDEHTYDMLNMVYNSTSDPIFTGNPFESKFGFVIISVSEGAPKSIIGSMRILDQAGYEYRTNAVEPRRLTARTNLNGLINFTGESGSIHSDLIGITFSETAERGTVLSNGVTAVFGGVVDSIYITDENSNRITCSPAVFSCDDDDTINYEIDFSMPGNIPNDKICNTSIITPGNTSGTLVMPFQETRCTNPPVTDDDGNCRFDTYFAGFWGLNNGSDRGVFDSWWGGEDTDD